MSDRRSEVDGGRGRRSPAEWTTLAVSLLVLGVVAALIVVQMVSTVDPAAPHAELGRTERVGDRYRVHVSVRNDGDETAANVQVNAALADETGDLSIDFLAGGEEQELVFLFDEDPSSGDLKVAVSGFEEP